MTMLTFLELGRDWDALGPFQVGTREAVWGADPLEYYGGFGSLAFSETTTYPSSLGSAGSVKWKSFSSPHCNYTEHSVSCELSIAFQDVDWEALKMVYGWASLQYQAWIRGKLILRSHDMQHVVLSVDNVLEFRLDDNTYFGGDFYAFGRAPVVFSLTPGEHCLEIHVVRDVRAMGGMDDPRTPINVQISIALDELFVDSANIVIPDIVENRFAAEFGSIPLRNQTAQWIGVLSIETPSANGKVQILDKRKIFIAPGQSRSIAVSLAHFSDGENLKVRVRYRMSKSSDTSVTKWASCKIGAREISEPHKVTFMHPSGTISYFILRPPMHSSVQNPERKSLPVLISLHGAGLDADSDQVRHMLDQVQNIKAWVLFPTGGTPWSADDWHSWGFADVKAAMAAIPAWIETMSWAGPSIRLDALYIVGHSNGGQGTWFALTHMPDKIKSAAPVSGYSSIQAYVPYMFWHEADPMIHSVIQRSLSGYRHELLLENAKGIPILQQHGSGDDNVPVFHSRRMHQLLTQIGSPGARYSELAGKGHWHDGVMVTPSLRTFYESISNRDADEPRLPEDFSIVVPCSGVMDSRGGILVEQLASPDQHGRIEVNREVGGLWKLKTTNIRRFRLSLPVPENIVVSSVLVDGCIFHMDAYRTGGQYWFTASKTHDGWTVRTDDGWKTLSERFGRQLGNMEAILRTEGEMCIRYAPGGLLSVATQASRNLYQYFGASCEIAEYSHSYCKAVEGLVGNVISIIQGLPLDDFQSVGWTAQGCPIAITKSGISVDGPGKHHDARSKKFYHNEPGLGAVFLVPRAKEAMELLVWGFDADGLAQAVRLIPTLTGAGQPDFVVVRKQCAWEGSAGVFALGFFDAQWRVSAASYLG